MSKTNLSTETPRVALFSLRSFENHVSRSHGYEFEDIIMSDLDHADLYTPKQRRFSSVLTKAKNWASQRASWAQSMPSGLQTMHLKQDYDLFFYSIAQMRDLNFLSSLKGWRRRSKTAICWIQELWVHDFKRQKKLLDQLNRFDFVICSFSGTTAALKPLLKVPVIFIPWGLDAPHFCPYPNPPKRAIDVLSIGVKHATTHKALIEHANKTGQLYFYDTISGRAEMQNHREHRQNYIGQLQRSKYFFSYVAKIERTIERGNQTEFGLRYIEGMAAGAVILGTRIESDAFDKHLGWTDSVIDVPFEFSSIGEFLDELNKQPERLELARKRNIVECLSRHDHVYRWEKILELAGLNENQRMKQRRAYLEQLIRVVKQDQTQLGEVV